MSRKRQSSFLWDGIKAVPLDPDAPGFEWAWTPYKAKNDERKIWEAVGSLRRAVELRANAVASTPRYWYRTDSDEPVPEESLPWGESFSGLLKAIESSICVSGAAYLLKDGGGKKATLKWLTSGSIKAREQKGDPPFYFQRYANGRSVDLTADELVYVWPPDPFKEWGPCEPLVRTALTDAGVIMNIGQYAAMFFERGAVGTSVLSTELPMGPDESGRLKKWWQQVGAGIRNAFTSEVFSAGKINITELSKSAKDLAMTELSQQAKEAIATTLGVPHSMLFSGAANFATARQDNQAFYELTILSELALIEEALNAQYFESAGYELWFAPEESTAMRAEAAALAASLGAFTTAGYPLDIATSTAGIELDTEAFVRVRMKALMAEGLEWEGAAKVVLDGEQDEERRAAMKAKLKLLKPPEPPPPPALPPGMPGQDPAAAPGADPNNPAAPVAKDQPIGSKPGFPPAKDRQPPPKSAKALDWTSPNEDLDKWMRKALKALDAGKSAAVPFQSDVLSEVKMAAIGGALDAAESESDVRDVFRFAMKETPQAFYERGIPAPREPPPPPPPPPPTINVTVAAPRVSVRNMIPEQKPPRVSVSVPEQPAPIVNVAAPTVNVEAPSVKVAAPQVNVPRIVKETQTVQRNQDGVMTGTTTRVTYEGDV